MTYADIVREALYRFGPPLNTGVTRKDALAALDALVAELDEARRDYEDQREYTDVQYRARLAAEAERERSAHIVRAWDIGEAKMLAAEAEVARLRSLLAITATAWTNSDRSITVSPHAGDAEVEICDFVRAALAPTKEGT